MQTKAIMKYFSTPTRMAKILKTEKTNIGENVKFVCAALGNEKECSYFRKYVDHSLHS